MVRSLNLLCQGHLAADAADCFSAGEAVSFLEARDLCFAVGGDDDDFIRAFVYACFEEEWDFVDHDGLGMFASDAFSQTDLLAGDAGMDDAFELPSFFLIAEDNASEGLSVERTVLAEYCLPEECNDLPPSRFARLHDIAGQFVGIDDDRAASLEHLGDSALAGGDAACEANQHHGGGA
jgi:hypothetical protein